MKIASAVRIVNKSPDMPHVLKWNSVWYIANPANGTQFVKHKIRKTVTKTIFDKARPDKVERVNKKSHAVTTLAQVFVKGDKEALVPMVRKLDDEENELFGQHVLDESKIPTGFKPKVLKGRNHVDVPTDAANCYLSGEYRAVNPDTQEKDWFYHGGDLIDLSKDHDLALAALTSQEAEQSKLQLENDLLASAIMEKRKELEALSVKVSVATPVDTGKGPGMTADSPTPPEKVSTSKKS